MKTNISCFKPEHGHEFKLDLRDPKVLNALQKINGLQREATIHLALFALSNQNNVYTVPCKQCWLNTALQFEEVGSLIRELAEGR